MRTDLNQFSRQAPQARGYQLAQVATGPVSIRSPLLPEVDALIESLFRRG
jgi:hypothetical protein